MLPEEIIKERILIFDGAMGTQIAQAGPAAADFGEYEGLNEYLSVTRPDLIEKIHSDYLAAGADVIETNTFGANAIVLAEYGLGNRVREFNMEAVKIAKRAAEKFYSPARPRFVAGSIGPTTASIFINSKISFDRLREVYFEQVCALIEGGADILLFETAHDILNVKAGLAAALDAFEKHGKRLPLIASLTMDRNDLMLTGHGVEAAYLALDHFPLFALGFNCSTGPEDMALRLKTLSEISRFPVFVMPNAGLPDENGKYLQTPEIFSRTLSGYAAKDYINMAGGCCGTGPGHIKALAENLAGRKPRAFRAKKEWAVSHIDPLFFREIEAPALAGERNNSIGSKKFRDLVAAGKWDEAVDIARAQAKAGAHVLDVCLANPDRNELGDLKVFLPMLSRAVKIPLMIDSTSLEAAELACKISGGKVIINSVNFEFGEEKPLKALELNRKYGAKIIFGLIDEDKEKGIPVLCERKMLIAERAYDFMVRKNGLDPQDLIFDALVFPVGVGGDYKTSAMETVNAIKEAKNAFPGVKTVLGVSNVSFGLPPKAREVLNAVFLHHAIKAGLDLAIVNIEKLLRYASIPDEERRLAEDLLFAKSETASTALADYFRNRKETAPKAAASAGTPEEKIYESILNGVKTGIEENVEEALSAKTPLEIINGPVLKAMARVGRLFSEGELIVTEVLLSAEATKRVVSALEPLMKKSETPKRGRILLATVRGDVHDIGKNLVSIIFESNGFEVTDLGIKVPSETIVEQALRLKPDFIGLSGLLVRSTEQMAVTARELAKSGVKAPLLVGGAALTGKYVLNNIEPVYEGPVFYAADAMDGLNKALDYITGRLPAKKGEAGGGEDVKQAVPSRGPNTEFYPDEIPEPKDFERKLFGEFDLEVLFDNLDEEMFNHRFLKLSKARAEKFEVTARLMDAMKAEILDKKLIKPRGMYRFFKAASKENSLLVFDEKNELLEEIFFPRQRKEKFLSITDFVAPLGSGETDYVAFMAATCGGDLKNISEGYRKAGDYLKSYLSEAFALLLAESFMEVLHRFVREDWGIAEKDPPKKLHRMKYRGKRYSFGYPACPDLASQGKLFRLIKPGDIGVTLTEHFMMEPEASVSAFALHNPKAVNFGA